MRSYRESYDWLIRWLNDAKQRQEKIQAVPIGDSEALKQQLHRRRYCTTDNKNNNSTKMLSVLYSNRETHLIHHRCEAPRTRRLPLQIGELKILSSMMECNVMLRYQDSVFQFYNLLLLQKLLEEIEKNKDKVEECQKHARSYIDAVKVRMQIRCHLK
jgi:hypothetical protein